jgi:hypothetical protein
MPHPPDPASHLPDTASAIVGTALVTASRGGEALVTAGTSAAAAAAVWKKAR